MDVPEMILNAFESTEELIFDPDAIIVVKELIFE